MDKSLILALLPLFTMILGGIIFYIGYKKKALK